MYATICFPMHVLTKFKPHITYTGRLRLKSFFVWIDFFLVKSISDFFHHTPSSDSEKQHPIPAPFMYITKKTPYDIGQYLQQRPEFDPGRTHSRGQWQHRRPLLKLRCSRSPHLHRFRRRLRQININSQRKANFSRSYSKSCIILQKC